MPVDPISAPTGPAASTSSTGPVPDLEARRAADAFERVLLGQLTKQLESTVGGSEPSGAAGAYASMIPEAMADALSSAGGIGLSDELVRTLRTQT